LWDCGRRRIFFAPYGKKGLDFSGPICLNTDTSKWGRCDAKAAVCFCNVGRDEKFIFRGTIQVQSVASGDIPTQRLTS